jgi:hypothetical protein
MPLVRKGPLNGFYLPDYRAGSIINLLSSIIRSRGGRSPHSELDGLPARALSGARKIVYLVVDGLGKDQLDRYLASRPRAAFFREHPHQTITTVFPATTAAAITTFSTGASPAEHAILGWHLHLPDLGMVSTILPGTTRTGAPMARDEFDLRRYLKLPLPLQSVPCRKRLISWGDIPESFFSTAGVRWDEVSSCTTLAGLSRQIAAFAKTPGRALAYAYWPGYDSFCHEAGCGHSKTVRHLSEIDRMLDGLVRKLRGTGTVLIVTADHGLVDSTPAHSISFREIPGFYDCLAVLPSGDARCAHCFVRPSKVRKFRSIFFQCLEKSCVCVRGEDLLKLGAFGPGKPHPALANRVGDFVLIAKADYCFGSHLPGELIEFNAANHGGMSPAEVRVPLYAVGVSKPSSA